MTLPPLTAQDVKLRLAQNVRSAREACGLSQAALADQMGRAANDVWRWETGLHQPSIESVLELATATGRDFAWFFAAHGSNGHAG